ncbi:MAG TPA: tetratricopeptide repeat protein, partial [Anaerolineae bacterium]|nr:tetratricopeptide repeat protein [Anaerolineae bacterium]
IAEQTLYQVRSVALRAITRVIKAEMEEPRDTQRRKHYAIVERYTVHTSEQQMILRLLAAFQRAMPHDLLYALIKQDRVDNIQEHLSLLVAAHWVVTNEQGSEFLLHPEVGQILLTRLLPDERQRWHRAIGGYFLERQEFYEAARQYRAGSAVEKAAAIIIDNYQAIVNDLQVEELLALIDTFHRADLPPDEWARLKIVSGDAAYLLEDLDTANAQYQHALNATAIDVKALAYFRRARVLAHKNLDEAFAHLAYCIRLLEARDVDNHLLVRVLVYRAMMYMEAQRDGQRAEEDLQMAAQLTSAEARAEWGDLQQAWLRLSMMMGDWQRAIESGQQAWLAANELQDVNRMIRTAHNLGMAYARLSRFDEAVSYLERSRNLAAEIGDRQRMGLNDKTLGGALFMVGRFQEAVEYYQQAYQVFSEMGNQNWRAHTCYDLAEAYAELEDITHLQRYYSEGLAAAEQYGDTRLVEEFAQFGRKYASLLSLLSPRQLTALNHIKQHGHITNRQYQQLNQVSPRQALRDLREMEAADIVVKLGKGRGTRYEKKGNAGQNE